MEFFGGFIIGGSIVGTLVYMLTSVADAKFYDGIIDSYKEMLTDNRQFYTKTVADYSEIITRYKIYYGMVDKEGTDKTAH